MADSDQKNAVSLAERLKLSLPAALEAHDPILIVQEQQDLRLIITHHLKKLNYLKISTVGNGYDALEFMKSAGHDFKMVICDLTMEVMGGVDFLAELKETTELRRPPFCMTIADPNKEKIMHAIESGVDEILVKPFTLGDLNPKIKKAFKIFNNPKNPEPVYELAKNWMRKEDFEKARMIYRLISEYAPQAARPIVGLARIAFREQKIDEALSLLEDASKRNPNFVFIYELRGQVFAAQKSWNEAIAQLRKAIELSPLNPVRYKVAAELLFQVERYQDAIALLTSGLERGIDFPDLYHFLSQAHYALDDYRAALKYIRTALAKQPENIAYLNQIGVCYRHLKEYEEGLKTYNQIIKLDPANRAALYNKAVLVHAMGNLDESIRILKKTTLKFPDFREAHAKLAAYEQEKKDASAA